MPDIYNMTDTWNAGGTRFDAIKMDVTDTASAAGSLLMDLKVGGVSKFAIDSDGVISIGNVPARWQTYTVDATWTKPAGLSAIKVYIRGGGAGGGATDGTDALNEFGGAGGTGAFCWKYILAEDLGATEGIVIGAGGAGGIAGANDGSNGGTSTFGTSPVIMTAPGGNGGKWVGHASRTTAQALATLATGGDYNSQGMTTANILISEDGGSFDAAVERAWDDQPYHRRDGEVSTYSAFWLPSGTGASTATQKGQPGGGANGNQSASFAGGDGLKGFCSIEEIF
jgi:hypothetical protein